MVWGKTFHQMMHGEWKAAFEPTEVFIFQLQLVRIYWKTSRSIANEDHARLLKPIFWYQYRANMCNTNGRLGYQISTIIFLWQSQQH